MTRTLVLPHAVAHAEHVEPGPWLRRTAAGPVELEATLPHWDYSTAVEVQREVGIHGSGVLDDCRLTPEDRLAIVASWRSTGTGLRGVGATRAIAQGTSTAEIAISLPGQDLGGVLLLETQIVLAEPGLSDHPIAPRRVGSIVWREMNRLVLEGLAARFPVEIIDFAESGIPAKDAVWYLEWPRGRLHETAAGSIRLYVNRRHPGLVEAVGEPEPDERGRTIWSAIKHDVGRTLILGVLADEEFISDPEAYDAGSAGASVRRLLDSLWPDEEIASLTAAMRQTPEDFAADLQERLRLFQDL